MVVVVVVVVVVAAAAVVVVVVVVVVEVVVVILFRNCKQKSRITYCKWSPYYIFSGIKCPIKILEIANELVHLAYNL